MKSQSTGGYCNCSFIIRRRNRPAPTEFGQKPTTCFCTHVYTLRTDVYCIWLPACVVFTMNYGVCWDKHLVRLRAQVVVEKQQCNGLFAFYLQGCPLALAVRNIPSFQYSSRSCFSPWGTRSRECLKPPISSDLPVDCEAFSFSFMPHSSSYHRILSLLCTLFIHFKD